MSLDRLLLIAALLSIGGRCDSVTLFEGAYKIRFAIESAGNCDAEVACGAVFQHFLGDFQSIFNDILHGRKEGVPFEKLHDIGFTVKRDI